MMLIALSLKLFIAFRASFIVACLLSCIMFLRVVFFPSCCSACSALALTCRK